MEWRGMASSSFSWGPLVGKRVLLRPPFFPVGNPTFRERCKGWRRRLRTVTVRPAAGGIKGEPALTRRVGRISRGNVLAATENDG